MSDYTIQLPGKKPVALKGWGNLPIELLAMIAGVKPVTQVWIQTADRGYLDELRDGLDLKSFIHADQGDRLGVMIGKSEANIKEAARAWDAPRSNPGPNLGYPDCCSQAYCAWIDDARPGRADYVFCIAEKTKSLDKLPFLLNDVCYLYSRPFSQGASEARREIEQKNRGLPMSLLNVIPWHPCSYRCPKSLAKAKKIWTLMGRHLPELAATIRATLEKPVLFWDWDRFAILEGKAAGYEGLRAPISRLAQADLELLVAGDRVELKKDSLEVRRGAKKLGAIKGRPILLDFSA